MIKYRKGTSFSNSNGDNQILQQQKLCLNPFRHWRESKSERQTKERMRCLLVSNAFTLKTQKQRVLADKKLFGCCSRAMQKSPFKEWNKHIPFLTQNKNCSRPSLLLWNILLTRLIKTTSQIHKRVSLPHPACQRSCKPTSHGFNFVFAGWGCEQCRHKQTPVERTWKPAAILVPTLNNAFLHCGWHFGLMCKHNR